MKLAALALAKHHQAQPQQARACLETWLRAFGDRFYLELTRVGHPGEAPVEEGSLALAARHGVPLVATNAVQFLRRADWEAHEVRWCINQGVKLGAAGVSSVSSSAGRPPLTIAVPSGTASSRRSMISNGTSGARRRTARRRRAA